MSPAFEVFNEGFIGDFPDALRLRLQHRQRPQDFALWPRPEIKRRLLKSPLKSPLKVLLPGLERMKRMRLRTS